MLTCPAGSGCMPQVEEQSPARAPAGPRAQPTSAAGGTSGAQIRRSVGTLRRATRTPCEPGALREHPCVPASSAYYEYR